MECTDLRKSHSYLSQGIKPHKKLTNIPDVKRYLKVARIFGRVIDAYIFPESGIGKN